MILDRRTGLSILILLASVPCYANRLIGEGIPASHNTVYIDTINTRVDIATTAYGGGISNVGLFISSNVVISNSAAGNNVVIYSSGSIMVNGTQTDTFWTSNGSNISNTNAGNVGIGTTNPQVLFNVATPKTWLGTTNANNDFNGTSASKNHILAYNSGNTTLANDLGVVIRNEGTTSLATTGLHFSGGSGSSGSNDFPIMASIVVAGGPRVSGQYTPSTMTFLVSGPGQNFAPREVMRLDNNGNVGIGTTNPGATLHSVGTQGGNVFVVGGTVGTDAGLVVKPKSSGTGVEVQGTSSALNAVAALNINPEGGNVGIYPGIIASDPGGANPASSNGFAYSMKSIDGGSQSAGCVVAISFADGGSGTALVFTSTTSANVNNPLGVLLQTCAPGAVCNVGYSGIYRVTSAGGVTAGNFIVTSTTRCQIADSGSAGTASHGRVLGTNGGAGGAWVTLGN